MNYFVKTFYINIQFLISKYYLYIIISPLYIFCYPLEHFLALNYAGFR